ncbi:hypothetical protein AB1Y20_000422 [Prymnesium parvum]|uniref:Uncharacterized protein n=1 Tax=Prymnesium parvum TaxID=97485 RepID=A0AB34K5S6_PRYPA
MDDAPKESRRGARVRWEALPPESGRSPTSTWSESVGGTPPDTPTPEKGTEGLDIPPWLVQAERMLLEGQSPPFPVAAAGLPATTGAEEMDMARWLDDAESMLHPAPPDASASSAPEAPSLAGAAAYDKSLIGDYTPNGTSVYGYDKYDARGGAATTPRAAPSRSDARSSLAGCEGEGRAQACLWTPPVGGAAAPLPYGGGTAATMAAARAQQAAEAAAAKVVAAERALQEAAAAKAAAQAAAEEAMAAAAAELAVAEGGRRGGGGSMAAGGAEDAAMPARARGEATATSTPPLRPPPPTPPPPFAQPRASASPPLRPRPAAAVPPAPAGRPRGASAPLPGSGRDAALAPSVAAAAAPAALPPAAAARRASESRGAAAPAKRKAWSARRGVVLTVLTAHGLLSPVAFHGWWCVPRIALLLPLLPVVDINFASPDGELLGNTFSLSRVLTLADLLSIITRDDALIQPTHTIYQDFEAACAWYVRCAIGFAVVCFLGSKLRRRMFNACFALASLALIACEIIMFGFVWPLAGAVLATVVLSLEPEKALERRFLKSD